VISYELKPDLTGIFFSTDRCTSQPCNILIFQTNLIRKTMQAYIVVTTEGNGTFYSSKFQISLNSKVKPYFEEDLHPVTLKVS
jgi:hypothetical protein